MAETQNVFVTRTQNRFLPIIQAFTDNLYKHMQMQGELNDKMIAFNKQREGEQFIGSYGEKLREAKTPEELNKVLGEATQYAGQRGLTPHLSVIGALAHSQGNMIKAEQDKTKADLFVNTASNIEATAPWNGNPNVKLQDIVTDIKNKYSDPTLQADALEQVFKTLNKVETGVQFDTKGNISIVSGTKDITGKQVATGEPISVGDNKGQYFLDINKNNVQDAGEGSVNPTDAEQISKIKMSIEEQRQQNARSNAQYGAMTRKTIFNPDTNTYMEVLENNYTGKYYSIDEQGNRGEQVSGKGFVSGVDYRALTKTSASGVNTFRKEKNDARNSINAELSNLSLREGDAKFLDKNGYFKEYVQESKSGTKYIDEVTLNKLMGTIKEKSKNRPNDLNEYEKKIISSGVYDRWEKDYWDKRKKYETAYDQFSQSYGERPTLEGDEPIEPYMQNREVQEPDKPYIIKNEGDLFWRYWDPNEKKEKKTFSKEKADSLYNLYKGL